MNAAALLLVLQAPAAMQAGSPFAVLERAANTSAGSAAGTFLAGTDDCNQLHVFLGTGAVAGVPFATGTIGGEGQNEWRCGFPTERGIDNDVWFDWTSDIDGLAWLTTCNGTTVDTKVSVWSFAGASQCPGGNSLACSEDGCGDQAVVTWHVTQGATYTIQLGSVPASSGGAGTFDIAAGSAPPCGQYDIEDGPTALGLTTGGETGWLHYFDCMQVVHTVSTMYGEPLTGDSMNGNHSWILVYEDASCDMDPTTDLTLRAAVDTVVVNDGTGLLNHVPIGPVAVSGCFWVAASADHEAGEFPAPMAFPETPAAWVVGSSQGPGTLNVQDLNANDVAPLQMNQIGFPASWQLRAQGETGSGTPYCSGDTSPTPCPCGNQADPGAGCGNGSFPEGALLLGSGSAVPDTLTLLASRATPLQPGLFFQGDEALAGGAGVPFGDGLRCAGTNVVRLEVTVADSGGFASSTVPLAATGGALPGETKYYQFWYRDPLLSPCDQGFNLTNGYSVTW